MAIKLIADSGSTKTEWCLMNGKSVKPLYTGLSPYFLSAEQIEYVINEELKVKFKNRARRNLFLWYRLQQCR